MTPLLSFSISREVCPRRKWCSSTSFSAEPHNLILSIHSTYLSVDMHFCVHKHHHRFTCCRSNVFRSTVECKNNLVILVYHYRFGTNHISGPARICDVPVPFSQLEHGTTSQHSWSHFTLLSPPLTHDGCEDADLCCLWCPRSISMPEGPGASRRALLRSFESPRARPERLRSRSVERPGEASWSP